MPLIFFLHIIFMSLGAFCFFISLIIVMTRKRFKGPWLNRHKMLNRIGILFMLIGFFSIFLYIQSYGGTHFLTVHSLFGIGTLLLLAITVLLMPWSMKKRKGTLNKMHPHMGRIALTLLLVTLILGLSLIF